MHTKKTLQVALVSDAIYPYNIGGKEKRIYEISTRLARAGHKVTIYTMHWWKGPEEEREENGVLLKAISPLYPLYAGERRSMKEAIMFAISCWKLVFARFDILEADHMPHLVLFPLKLVCLVKRKKLFVTWNEVWGRKYWVKYLGPLGNIAYIIEWLSVRLPDEVISISDETTEKLRSSLHAGQKIKTITNGIDFDVINAIKPSNMTSDVIFAGRLLRHKNVHVLLEAVALLKKEFPQILCTVIGRGPEKDRLKAQAEKLGITPNVRFIDFLRKHADVYAMIKSAKVFAFPSTREGFGLVVLEANACNVPVVTIDSKDNASRFLIENEKNGRLVKLDAGDMGQAIKSYIQKKHKKDMGVYVKKYSWNYIERQIENLYEHEAA